jgi:hypothetical protein
VFSFRAESILRRRINLGMNQYEKKNQFGDESIWDVFFCLFIFENENLASECVLCILLEEDF